MNCLKTIFISTISISCILPLYSLAANTDCVMFSNLTLNWKDAFDIVESTRIKDNQYSNFLSTEQKNAIIDKDSLNTAILNLKKYCCENNVDDIKYTSKTCETDNWLFNDNALDSPYLFDHLFDVIMRRLSWMTWDEAIYKTQKIQVDEKWQERRTRINDKAENLSGANPWEIINKYNTFRILTPEYNITQKVNEEYPSSTSDFLSYVSWKWWWESESIAKSLQEYDKWTLYDRYNNACILSEYFYNLFNQWIESSDKNHLVRNISQWTCISVIERQIKNETEYTKQIIQSSSNLFMKNYITSYISYLHDRMTTLKDTRHGTVDKWTAVVRAVPQLVKHCTK